MKKWISAVIGVLMALLISMGVFSYFTYGYGTLIVKIIDPPADWGPASQVYINCSAIMVHRAGAKDESGWHTVVEDVGWINLTAVLNVSKIVGKGGLPAGLYNLVRFEILEANVTVGGINYTAAVEPGKLTAAIIEGGVRINAGGTAYLVIDINTRVTGSPTNLKLVPAARAFPHQ